MNRIAVAVDQLDAFKLQAKRFAGIVARLTNNSITVRKSNREDFLAWACGYKNFSELSITAKSFPSSDAPLVLADVPEKRALLRARCLNNPFGRLVPDLADKAIAQLPTPVTPLNVLISPKFNDDLEIFDPAEYEWIYKEFTFETCRALDKVRSVVKALNHTSIFEQRTQVFAKVIGTLSHQHTERLRRRLNELKPGAADTIDRFVPEIRSSTRKIKQIQFDANPISETTDIAVLYTYWRHSSDIIGKGGISHSAINRQFARSVSLALMNQPAYALAITWACPTCGNNSAQLTLSDVSYKNVSWMKHSCPSCGHEERYSQFHTWSLDRPLNKLQCRCRMCVDTVMQAAKTLAPASTTLWADVAKWTRTFSQQEKARLRSLTQRAHRIEPDNISSRARKFISTAAGNQSYSIWKEIVAIVGDKFRYWPDQMAAHDSLIDELIGMGAIGIDFDDLVDDNDDDELIIRCLFGEHAGYLDRHRDSAPNVDQHWPYDGPWKGNWSALLSRFQRGFHLEDRKDFEEWLYAVNESDLLSHYFRMPFILGLYINAEQVEYLRGAKLHG